MPDPRGFLTVHRQDPEKEPVDTRLHHYREFERGLPVLQAREQARRCMGCGVPFCHTGCPLGNVIPDFNDLVRQDRWAEAFASLESTNNFPEITGRICPAPCEAACVVALHDQPVAIKALERAIGDRAAEDGFLQRVPSIAPATGKKVAVVGSGPAGLACAEQLARAGHQVTVLERDDRIGGLLRYGIPDFKLEKEIVETRIVRMTKMGVTFRTGVHVGIDVTLATLRKQHDAVVLAIGATVPRDLPIEGRSLEGVHFAMDYLVGQNRVVAGDLEAAPISAAGKRVVILGGGDTGSDCLGTALRQGATSVVQLELLPRPPETPSPKTPWPLWPLVYRTSSSQEEGGRREYSVLTKRFVAGDGGRVRALEVAHVEATAAGVVETDGRERATIEADLVLLAMGFVGCDATAGVWDGAASPSSTSDDFRVSHPSLDGIFACGDARRGASLVVWAIWEGRETARAVDSFLSRRTALPTSPYAYAL